MSVEIKEKPRTPKFKDGDKVIIKYGERKGWHGVIQAKIRDNKYAIVFPCCNPHLAYFYPEEGLRPDDAINEIMAIFKNEHLNPVVAGDRIYARGWIDCSYYDETITLEQRDELYKRMGIE